jgi:hypothetical protein
VIGKASRVVLSTVSQGGLACEFLSDVWLESSTASALAPYLHMRSRGESLSLHRSGAIKGIPIPATSY